MCKWHLNSSWFCLLFSTSQLVYYQMKLLQLKTILSFRCHSAYLPFTHVLVCNFFNASLVHFGSFLSCLSLTGKGLLKVKLSPTILSISLCKCVNKISKAEFHTIWVIVILKLTHIWYWSNMSSNAKITHSKGKSEWFSIPNKTNRGKGKGEKLKA